MNNGQSRAGIFNYVSALTAALRCFGKVRRVQVLQEVEAVHLIHRHFGTKLNEKFHTDQKLNLLILM